MILVVVVVDVVDGFHYLLIEAVPAYFAPFVAIDQLLVVSAVVCCGASVTLMGTV